MRRKTKKPTENFVWISFSDLLTTLLLSFIVIAISSIVQARSQIEKVNEANKEALKGRECLDRTDKQLAERNNLTSRLRAANEAVLAKLALKKTESGLCKEAGVEINESGDGIRLFIANDADDQEWFKDGRSELGERAQSCLDEFSKLWLGSIVEQNLKEKIDQLIIEGHSNSKPYPNTNESSNFLRNLELSQQRALAAATYMLQSDSTLNDWKRQKLTAVGKSYLETIKRSDRSEDYTKSKRLEFRAKLKFENWNEI